LAQGGQNPAEAIAAGVAVITGPHMGNFEPLVTMLRDAGGITMLSSAKELGKALQDVLADPEHADQVCQRAKNVLANHQNAVQKTIELLDMNASVSRGNMQE
jgi:3-deoxy-D-manno-octulosonic-acid transferase